MRHLKYAFALGLLGGGVALAGAGDKSFVDRAACGGLAEVQLSKLAMNKGHAMDVKQFARKMVEEHSKVNLELEQIAEKERLPLPTTIDDKHRKIYDQLVKLDGAGFDEQYLRAMAADHDDAVALFKEQSRDGADQELKSFAMKTLPMLQKHDDLAHRDHDRVQKAD